MPHRFVVLVLGVVLLAACETEPDFGPPAGWEIADADRWWQEGVDTARAFRDLSDFEAMGLSEREDGLRDESAIVRNVQRRFLPLYRNHPEVVDSVFAQIAVPVIEEEAQPGQPDAERDAIISRINRRIHRVFYPPQPRAADSPPIVVPDSLQEQGISGTIALQVYLDAAGQPQAIQKIEGMHPTMDLIVMRNYTQRSWQPAHLNGEPIESWLRATINIGE